MSVEHWQKNNDRNNQSTETKTCFNATLYYINRTWIPWIWGTVSCSWSAQTKACRSSI